MDQIVNNFWLTRNLTRVKNIKNMQSNNPTVRFSKYVVMLILLVGVVAFGYNQVCNQTLSFWYLRV